jgi:6,7-dimethyl-8-ribityllumazine synthase
MLKSVRAKSLTAGAARFVIVASRYNAKYVDAMVRAAQSELKRAGAKHVQVLRVPGAYEIPVVAAHVARAHAPHTPFGSAGADQNSASLAIICLGVILRGETSHAAHIGEAVSNSLMQIQLQYGVPVIHEVLLLENEAQARARCLNPRHNRGTEAAQTALAMAQLIAKIAK